MLLKRHKSELLGLVTKLEIDPEIFTILDAGNEFTLCVAQTDVCFRIQHSALDFNKFTTYVQFLTPSTLTVLKHGPELFWRRVRRLIAESTFVEFGDVLARFEKWLREDVLALVDEWSRADPWSAVLRAGFNLGTENNRDERFDSAEAEWLRAGLETFRRRLFDEFRPTQEQMAQVNERLDHLSSAIDRLTRFDFSGLAMNVIINIATTLALDGNKALALAQLFRSAVLSAARAISPS
jgi:hypothetical protein